MAVNFCLPKPVVDKFKSKVRSGEFHPMKLKNMTTEERRAAFTEVMGADAAVEVNKNFESKLLLLNQEQGFIKWIKQTTGIEQKQRDAMAEKVKQRYAEKKRRMLNPTEEESLLGELVADYYSKRVRGEVTLEEAKKLHDLYRKSEDLKEKADKDGNFPNDEARLEYGFAQVEYLDYIAELKQEAHKLPFTEVVRSPKEITLRTLSAAKSVVASLDNSFFGRQGVKMLVDHPKSWGKAFIKSWGDIAKGLQNIDAMKAIRAEIYSRPNALNGKYAAGGGYDLGVNTEEDFPSSLPERIPVLGRVFKGTEYAFNGAALRLRADMADKLIAKAEDNGVDIYNKEEAKEMARFVGAMTGRGDIGRANAFGKELNTLLFSIKFLKSNIDTLTAPFKALPSVQRKLTGQQMEAGDFTKLQSAKTTMKVISTMAAVLAMADLLGDDDTVEWDSRSSDFGKIRVGDTRFDVTGGMGSLIVLASRMLPTTHNGEWGFWRKSSTTGEYFKSSAKYGETDALNTLVDFGFGKLSPGAGVLRDIWRGEMFGGKPVTPRNVLENLTTPIILQNAEELLKNPKSANIVLALILDGLGFGSNTYSLGNNWGNELSEELQGLKDKVGEKEFEEARTLYDTTLNSYFTNMKDGKKWQNATDEEKSEMLKSIRESSKQYVFNKYNYNYKYDQTSEYEDKLESALSTLDIKKATQIAKEYNKNVDKIIKEKGGKLSKKDRTKLLDTKINVDSFHTRKPYKDKRDSTLGFNPAKKFTENENKVNKLLSKGDYVGAVRAAREHNSSWSRAVNKAKGLPKSEIEYLKRPNKFISITGLKRRKAWTDR